MTLSDSYFGAPDQPRPNRIGIGMKHIAGVGWNNTPGAQFHFVLQLLAPPTGIT